MRAAATIAVKASSGKISGSWSEATVRMANIIDRETNLPGLIAALEDFLGNHSTSRMQCECCFCRRARKALADARVKE